MSVAANWQRGNCLMKQSPKAMRNLRDEIEAYINGLIAANVILSDYCGGPIQSPTTG